MNPLRPTAALLMLAVLFLNGCSKPFAEFKSAEGKFRVQMPGAPKAESKNSGSLVFHNYSIDLGSKAYVVSYSDMPIDPGESDDQIQMRLDGAADGMVGKTGNTLTSKARITLDGKYPGRDVLVALPGGKGSLIAKIYIVNARLYQLVAVGPDSWVKGPDVTKFLTSFALLP